MTLSKFTCHHCEKEVAINRKAGIQNRNHCPYCLYSIHLDLKIPGDRKSTCNGEMEPIGLAFKKIKPDKYKNDSGGELMLIHYCLLCDKISLNRIAGDDNPTEILKVFQTSLKLSSKIKDKLKKLGITIASKDKLQIIKQQLFGKL